MLEKMNSWVMRLYLRQENLKHELKRPITSQRGAGAVEYALVVAVIVVMVVGAAAFMREPLEEFFGDVIAFVRGKFGI